MNRADPGAKPAAQRALPHLIHIGLPKAGSTFLQEWFAAHPQVGYCHGGIAGFRDIYAVAAAATLPDPALRCRVTSAEGLSAPRTDSGGESVNLNYERCGRPRIAEEQARVCAILADLHPGASILIVTRGFRSAILSGYSEFVRTGGSEDIHDVLKPPARDYPWNYDTLIGLYRAAFGNANVIVLPFELLRDDSGQFLGEVEKRLGLDHFPFLSPPVNVSASPVELAWYPAMTRTVRRVPFARGLVRRSYGRLLYRRRLAFLARLFQRVSPRPPVTPVLIGDDFLEQFRGQGELLRGEPLYAPYLADYLL